MKKPMKFKRYEGGGEISGAVDPKESADKEAGLKASKGEDVGFFKRLRMGNIDDPNSEAYKQFGAGRGRNAVERDESVSINEPRAVARPSMKPNPIFAAGEQQGKRQPSGDASVAEDYSGSRTKPIVTTSVDKPAAPKDRIDKPAASKAKIDDVAMREANEPKGSTGQDMRGETNMSNYKPRRTPVTVGNDKRGETDMSKYKPRRSSDNPDMSKYKPRRTPGANTSYENKDTSDMSYKKGGKVGAASRRADGIATKGKTRGKMC